MGKLRVTERQETQEKGRKERKFHILGKRRMRIGRKRDLYLQLSPNCSPIGHTFPRNALQFFCFVYGWCYVVYVRTVSNGLCSFAHDVLNSYTNDDQKSYGWFADGAHENRQNHRQARSDVHTIYEGEKTVHPK